jgi:hypothetical protein
MTIALTGTTTEPVKANSSSAVAAPMTSSAHGSRSTSASW